MHLCSRYLYMAYPYITYMAYLYMALLCVHNHLISIFCVFEACGHPLPLPGINKI